MRWATSKVSGSEERWNSINIILYKFVFLWWNVNLWNIISSQFIHHCFFHTIFWGTWFHLIEPYSETLRLHFCSLIARQPDIFLVLLLVGFCIYSGFFLSKHNIERWDWIVVWDTDTNLRALDDNPETATVDSESSMAKMFRFSEEVTNMSQKGHNQGWCGILKKFQGTDIPKFSYWYCNSISFDLYLYWFSWNIPVLPRKWL